MEFEPRKINLSDEVSNLINDTSSINDMMSDVIRKMSNDINAKKEAVMKQKIKEITGLEIDFKKELERRFKRFCIVNVGNKQTIYFDDGSVSGKRIVTFERIEIPFNPDNYSIGYEEKYY